MSERLLTEVEIAGVCGRFARPENEKEGLHLLAEMAADAEHKATLKAVGEFLDERFPNISLTELAGLIACLKDGKMPQTKKGGKPSSKRGVRGS